MLTGAVGERVFGDGRPGLAVRAAPHVLSRCERKRYITASSSSPPSSNNNKLTNLKVIAIGGRVLVSAGVRTAVAELAVQHRREAARHVPVTIIATAIILNTKCSTSNSSSAKVKWTKAKQRNNEKSCNRSQIVPVEVTTTAKALT